ncbi:hypothetical protein AMECASPLE_018931 [Ameca splendens]|uniref:Interleukin-7 n=1 Tax=Ameca splendens TaxID=208324 RepID=A0ABV0YEU7_9TELE
MPLLCINLLVLVLLPLSLSCDSQNLPIEDQQNFLALVRTHMDNTRENITDELQNLSCLELKHKPPNCTTEKADFVETLLIQACEMQSLRLQQTKDLAKFVQTSLECPCPKKPTKDPSVKSQKRMARNPGKKHIKKLCKAKAILSCMTLCYEKLNTLLMDA